MTTWVSILGNAGDPATHSGTQYYFYRSLGDQCPDVRAMTLSSEMAAPLRLGWAASRLARLRRLGGFQFSRTFLEAVWAPVSRDIADSRVINFFQLYAPSVVARRDVERWYYIDLSLRQLFDVYGFGRRLGRRDRADALGRERDGYQSAAGIIAMSRFAADSIRADYGLPYDRVRVAHPGANLDRDAFDGSTAVEMAPVGDRPPRQVGFVGKDWARKGLDRLIRGLALARAAGHPFELLVIGCGADDVPAELRQPWVRWAGLVDKRRRASEFVKLLSSCDIGCLLSVADASPIALREFHAVGRPTIATDVGGCRDIVPGDASILLPGSATDHDVATAFTALATNATRFSALARNAWARREEARWPSTVGRIVSMFSPGTGADVSDAPAWPVEKKDGPR